MPTTQTVRRDPPFRDFEGFPKALQYWFLESQRQLPLRLVDTSTGPYAEDLPPAGLTSATAVVGETAQNREIIFCKSSADANVFTVNGAIDGPHTLTNQYETLRFKSNGTNWYPACCGSSSGGGGLGPSFYFVGPGITQFSDVVSIGFTSMTAVNNQVAGLLFALEDPITFTQYSYNAQDNVFPGDAAAFALYDDTGARVFQEVFATQVAGAGPFAKVTAGIALSKGMYYLMTSAQHTTANIMAFPSIDADLRVLLNLQNPLGIVKSPNAFNGIDMPASLGVVTDIGPDAYAIPAVVFKQ